MPEPQTRRWRSSTASTPPGSRGCAASAQTACSGPAGRRRGRTRSTRWPNLCCTSTGRRSTTGRKSHFCVISTGRKETLAMSFDFQIAVDSATPHELADWWAETLGWVLEPTDEAFIRRMIAEGYASEDETITHNGALAWRDGAAIRHPDVPTGLVRPRILFQFVPEPKTVKNRWHIDIR